MKFQGQAPHKDKYLLSSARCCLTGSVSSVFAHTLFRFPMVKYTLLPSLEVGFLKYAPMKTEASNERETRRMETFSLRELHN